MPPKRDSVQSSRPSPSKWQGSKLGPDELPAGLVPGCHSSGGRHVLPGLVGDNWAGLGAYQLSASVSRRNTQTSGSWSSGRNRFVYLQGICLRGGGRASSCLEMKTPPGKGGTGPQPHVLLPHSPFPPFTVGGLPADGDGDLRQTLGVPFNPT